MLEQIKRLMSSLICFVNPSRKRNQMRSHPKLRNVKKTRDLNSGVRSQHNKKKERERTMTPGPSRRCIQPREKKKIICEFPLQRVHNFRVCLFLFLLFSFLWFRRVTGCNLLVSMRCRKRSALWIRNHGHTYYRRWLLCTQSIRRNTLSRRQWGNVSIGWGHLREINK